MKFFEKMWYSRSWREIISFLLIPAALVFRLIVAARSQCYMRGWLAQYKSSVPVIVVGNITVGGTGKTPCVIALVRQLQGQGHYPAVVLRGYGGSEHSPTLVTGCSTAKEVGDEAVLIYRATDVPVMVGRRRTEVVTELLKHHYCNVIICDDGLQHYALARDKEIVVVDGEREFGNGRLLPAGPLREPVARLGSVDAVVVNGDSMGSAESMSIQAKYFRNVKTQEKVDVYHFSGQKKCLAIAGIGNPQRFFSTLMDLDIEFESKSYADHYAYQESDFSYEHDKLILMTEKDAVKCYEFATENMWYLKIEAELPMIVKQITDELLSDE